MGLSSYSGGGGGKTFLPSDQVEDDMPAVLTEQPVMQEKDFGSGPETVPTFIMQVEKLRDAGDNPEGIFEWTPGKFAVGHLLETLGTDESKWVYPVEGHFERRVVQTKFGKKKALHFIPDGTTEEESPKGPSRTTASRPSTKGTANSKPQGSTSKAEFTCKRHPKIAFGSKDDYLAHLETH
ncbi:MAG: hypothetical protein ACREQ5_06095 [Candidatus Dormibacteria bacterium]